MAIAARMDRLAMGRFHWKLTLVSGFANAIRSMDVVIITYVLASLIVDWKLSPAEAGAVGSISIAGMVLGVAVVGVLADRFGRKFMLEVTFILFIIGTALSGISWGLASLLFFRFVTGIGLGGIHPPLLTLVGELSPSRHRGKMILFLELFWVIGSIMAALIAYLVIPTWGWRMALFVGAAPLLSILVIHRMLPESPRFLWANGKRLEAEETVSQIERECGVDPEIGSPSAASDGAARPAVPRAGFAELFVGVYYRRTICLTILWLVSAYCYYGIFTWLPSLVVAAGFTMVDSFQLMLIITLVQVPGCLAGAVLVDRIGRKRTIVPFLLLAGVSAYLFGLSTSSQNIIIWGSLISFFMMGSRGVVSTYTSELYPTRLRSTGAGWAGSVGRIAGTAAPMATGLIVSQSGGSYALVFLTFAVLLALGGLNVAFLGEETAGQSLEKISA